MIELTHGVTVYNNRLGKIRMELTTLQYWDVIREGSEVWVTYEVCPGYVYDPLVSCLVNNPKELDGLCASVASKNWGSQAMADELRSIVESLKPTAVR